MSATAFIASINSNSAASAQNSETLCIKLMCGGLITLNFGNPSQMEAVARVIIDAVRGEPEPEYLVPTTPVAVHLDSEKDEKLDVDSTNKEVSSEESSKEEEAPGSPESSFESYGGGYGSLTQEINF